MCSCLLLPRLTLWRLLTSLLPLQGVGLKHLTGDVKSILGRITETDQVGGWLVR